jgi:hypothetical protein
MIMWRDVQNSLWVEWKKRDPVLTERELWKKYKHEWIEAYRPFVKERDSPHWLLKA